MEYYNVERNWDILLLTKVDGYDDSKKIILDLFATAVIEN